MKSWPEEKIYAEKEAMQICDKKVGKYRKNVTETKTVSEININFCKN